jgi:hypothetical protein
LSRIIHNSELIAVEHWERGTKTSRMAYWADVFHVVAFKRDLFHVDLICMEIQDRLNSSIEVDEEMEGWKELVANLPEYLPGFPKFEEWFLRVATPAFETCPTELYRRA